MRDFEVDAHYSTPTRWRGVEDGAWQGEANL